MELTYPLFFGLFVVSFLFSGLGIYLCMKGKKKWIEYQKLMKKKKEKEEKSKIVKRKITKEEKKWMTDEMKELHLPSDLNTVLYVYTLEIDGKQCLKIGITKSDILKRIIKYLFAEHYDQDKKIIDSFRMLYIHNFENDKVARKIEGAFKDRLSCFPLTEGQKWQTEQYMFVDAWDAVKDELNQRIIFSNGFWKRENFDLVVPPTRPLHILHPEPKDDDKLNTGILREITGGNELIARSVKKDEVLEFTPKFNLTVDCGFPNLHKDDGTWRRIKTIPMKHDSNVNNQNSESSLPSSLSSGTSGNNAFTDGENKKSS